MNVIHRFSYLLYLCFRITEGEDGEKLQILQFTPTLEDNEKMLTCEYGERGEQVFSDHITMGIYVMDLPSDTITPGLVAEGDPIRLEVTAGLYPAPEPEDILWEVKNPDGEVVVEMSPGGQDEYGIYKAGEIEVSTKQNTCLLILLTVAF